MKVNGISTVNLNSSQGKKALQYFNGQSVLALEVQQNAYNDGSQAKVSLMPRELESKLDSRLSKQIKELRRKERLNNVSIAITLCSGGVLSIGVRHNIVEFCNLTKTISNILVMSDYECFSIVSENGVYLSGYCLSGEDCPLHSRLKFNLGFQDSYSERTHTPIPVSHCVAEIARDQIRTKDLIVDIEDQELEKSAIAFLQDAGFSDHQVKLIAVSLD